MLDSATKAIIGGFCPAQAGEGLGWILHYWQGVTFRDSATLLNDACVASGKTSMLDRAAQAILTNSRLTHIVDQPLEN